MDSREYANCDAIELAMRISRGDVNAVEVLDLAYGLIDRLDPQVNAFVHREAELAYATARSPSRGPLSGVPIAMKDCVGGVRGAIRDYGSRLATGLRLDTDDEVVVRLKAAGLVPMGTTNVPEFSSSLTAESRLHGPCRNPWDPARSTGGSSGGAAAAVACGVVPIAYRQ
jgi:amidase